MTKNIAEEGDLKYNQSIIISNGLEIGMRFFHMADLHFGKNIHGYSMIEMKDQIFWIDQIIKKVEELKPDAVLIAGDVYDRAVPSKEAVKLLDDFLTKLAERKVPVLLIAGNHDSGSRLAFADQLLCHQGIYIAGEATKKVKNVTLYDEFGPVHFWLVPYIFPAAIQVLLDRDDIKDYDEAMRALLMHQDFDFTERNVILSHQFVVAGAEKPTMGGSETTVGGIGQIDASVFKEFDYAALGHIHNAQKMGSGSIRYAGSPLTYHFSESGQKKGLTVVDLKEKGNLEVVVEGIPVLHKMCEISGTMEELLHVDIEKNCYVRAVIKQELLPPQAVEVLRNYFETKDCILMEVVRDFSVASKKYSEMKTKDIQQFSLEELFTEFYRHMHQGELPEEQFSKLISFTAEQARNSADETEQERKEATRKLVEYAAKLNLEEESV